MVPVARVAPARKPPLVDAEAAVVMPNMTLHDSTPTLFTPFMYFALLASMKWPA